MGGPWPMLPLGSLYSSFFLGPGSNSLHIAFLGSWVGWVGRGPEAGVSFGSLHDSFFLGSWVRGPRQEVGLALRSLYLFWALERMEGPRPRAGPLHVSFLEYWVG